MGDFIDSLKKEVYKELEPEIEKVKQSYAELKDTILPMVNENVEEERTNDIVKLREYKQYLFIKHEYKYWYITEKDIYYIYDSLQQLKYKIEGNFWFGCHRLKIYQGDKRIGVIKRNWIPYPDLIEFEFGVRKSKIQFDEEEFFIRSHRESGGRRYKINKKHWKISYSKKEDSYSIAYMKNVIAKVYKPLKSSAHSNKNWIVGYDELEKEFDIAVIAVSLWNMIRK